MTPPMGKLITLEGGEGAGKSTLLAGLRDYLQLNGVALVQTREPGGTRHWRGRAGDRARCRPWRAGGGDGIVADVRLAGAAGA